MPTDAALLRARVAVDENQAGRACGPELRGKHNFNLVRPGRGDVGAAKFSPAMKANARASTLKALMAFQTSE
jgi:hypothetical protein